MKSGEILNSNIGTESFGAEATIVDTAGKNAVKIKEYIKNQLKEDELEEQLTFNNTDPFMGSK